MEATTTTTGGDLLTGLENHLNHALMMARSTSLNRLVFDRDYGMDKMEENHQWGFTLKNKEPLTEGAVVILQGYFTAVFQSQLDVCQRYHGPTGTMLTKLLFIPTENALRLMFLHPSQIQFEHQLQYQQQHRREHVLEEGSDEWGRVFIQTNFIILYTWVFIATIFFSVIMCVKCKSAQCVRDSIHLLSSESIVSMLLGGIVTYIGMKKGKRKID